jgi:hypothetical protein
MLFTRRLLMRRDHRCRTALIALAAVILAGCGVPQDGRVQVVGAENIPAGVPRSTTTAAPTPATASPTTSAGVIAEIAFVLDDQLVLRPRRIPVATSVGQVQALLNELQRGPSSLERSYGLESTLSNAAGLTVSGLQATVVTVDISAEPADQSPDRLPLIIGQLVFTVTSVRGVGALQLERDGRVVDAPLPGGTLSSAPLTRADFQPLTTPAPTAPAPTGS